MLRGVRRRSKTYEIVQNNKTTTHHNSNNTDKKRKITALQSTEPNQPKQTAQPTHETLDPLVQLQINKFATEVPHFPQTLLQLTIL